MYTAAETGEAGSRAGRRERQAQSVRTVRGGGGARPEGAAQHRSSHISVGAAANQGTGDVHGMGRRRDDVARQELASAGHGC